MRITREQMFMEMAATAARRSTCFRANVGAIVTHENNVVAIGYNGPPSGEPHCTGHTCPGAQTGCTRAIHAEINAIQRIPRVVKAPLSLYLTHSPCYDCAKRIIATQVIGHVYFRDLYRLNDHLILLIHSEIPVTQLMPSGFAIDWLTRELVEL